MALTAAQTAAIRNEIGSSPDDATLQTLYDSLGNTTAVSLAVLRPRLADARTAASSGGFSLSGVLGTTAPSAQVLAQLDAQIARLEAELAAETGTVDDSGLAATSVIAGRYDRPR